jgi:transcriptional regulator with XRE-family HTH domain
MTNSRTTDPAELWRRRVLARISQAELAKRAGVTQSYVSLIERGKRDHPEAVEAVAKALDELVQLKVAA